MIHFDGLRNLLDGLNEIPEDVVGAFEAKLSEIDEKAEKLSKPLDKTWTEWQEASRLIPDNESLTVLRIDEDDDGRVLVITHHSEIGAIGLWLPEGGIQAAPGNLISIQDSRVKVARPPDLLRDIHNIRGLVAVENPDALSFTVRTDEILDDEDESELSVQ